MVDHYNLSLVSPDSSYKHLYESPRISGLSDARMEHDINRFLKSKFYPSRAEIKEFKSEFSIKSSEASAMTPHWDYLESSFSINLKTPELLMLERNCLHEFEGMPEGRWETEMFAIDMTTGEWIEYLYELFDATQTKEFNTILRSCNDSFESEDIYVDLSRQKEFSIFENKDQGLWLVLYIPPFGEYKIVEEGELVTISNGYVPMRFEFPLKLLSHIIVKDSVLKKVVHKRTQ